MSSPNPITLPVNAGTLPGGVCPATLQDLLNLFSANQSVTFPSTFSGVTASPTKPTDTTQVWLQLDTLGRPVRVYYFAQGAWLSMHNLPPGFILIYPYAAPDFTTFDGGDANALSAISGPMWQLPVDLSGNPILRAQFPLGAGTLPSGTVIAVTNTGGEEKHVLTVPEMPPHGHALVPRTFSYAGGPAPAEDIQPTASDPNRAPDSINTKNTGGDPTTNPPNIAAAGHNTLPPFYGVNFLQRTNRLFYSVT